MRTVLKGHSIRKVGNHFSSSPVRTLCRISDMSLLKGVTTQSFSYRVILLSQQSYQNSSHRHILPGRFVP